MDAAALAGWTPVALAVDAAGAIAIDWGDLRGVRFAEPFFQQTVERWAGGDPAPLVRTGLDALEALDHTPSLDPAAFIFHLSRCGSTLCTRVLGALEGTLVLSEPPPVNALLTAEMAGLGAERAVPLLRLLLRALARRRFGDEQRAVFKLSSWNVRRLALFRRAFPATPVIWIQRDPTDVLASLAADPPSWALALRQSPGFAHALAAEPVSGTTSLADCLAAVIIASLRAIAEARPPSFLALDYRELPEAVWTRIAPFLGIALPDEVVPRLREIARYDAKSVTPKLFSPSAGSDRAALPEALQARLRLRALPLYEALATAG